MTEYSEREVDKMLKEQESNIRLSGLEIAFKDLSDSIQKHINREEAEMKEVMKALDKNANERRACEAGIRRDMNALFVKKADLKLYAILIITASSVTTGIITYIGSVSTKNAQTSAIGATVEQLEQVLSKKLKNFADLKESKYGK